MREIYILGNLFFSSIFVLIGLCLLYILINGFKDIKKQISEGYIINTKGVKVYKNENVIGYKSDIIFNYFFLFIFTGLGGILFLYGGLFLTLLYVNNYMFDIFDFIFLIISYCLIILLFLTIKNHLPTKYMAMEEKKIQPLKKKTTKKRRIKTLHISLAFDHMIDAVRNLKGFKDVISFYVDDYFIQVIYFPKMQEEKRYGLVFFLYEPDNRYGQKPTSHYRDRIISYFNSNGIEWEENSNRNPKEIWTFTGFPEKAAKISKDIFEKVLGKQNYELGID